VAGGRTEGGVLAETLQQPWQQHRHHGGDRAARKQRERHRRGDAAVAPDEPGEWEEGKGDGESDRNPGRELASQDRAYGHPDREAADHQRLGLRAHGIGHVDDTGNEDCEQDVLLELLLKRRDATGRMFARDANTFDHAAIVVR
jgi:hypothetical protein